MFTDEWKTDILLMDEARNFRHILKGKVWNNGNRKNKLRTMAASD